MHPGRVGGAAATQPAAVREDPLARGCQRRLRRFVLLRHAAELELELVGEVPKRHSREGIRRVVQGGERVLKDTVGRQLDAERERPALAVQVQIDKPTPSARIG